MNLFKKAVATTLVLFMSVSTFAADPASYGGYSVSRIIENTTTLFEQKHLLDPYSKTALEWNKFWEGAVEEHYNGFLPAMPFMDFENSLVNYCIGKGFISYKQATEAIEKSQKVGGLEVNGYNLLYLHAEILWALVVNKYITQKEAQNLLDSSKVK